MPSIRVNKPHPATGELRLLQAPRLGLPPTPKSSAHFTWEDVPSDDVESGIVRDNKYPTTVLTHQMMQYFADAPDVAPAVFFSTAIATAPDPVAYEHAFKQGIEAGRLAYVSGIPQAQNIGRYAHSDEDKPVDIRYFIVDAGKKVQTFEGLTELSGDTYENTSFKAEKLTVGRQTYNDVTVSDGKVTGYSIGEGESKQSFKGLTNVTFNETGQPSFKAEKLTVGNTTYHNVPVVDGEWSIGRIDSVLDSDTGKLYEIESFYLTQSQQPVMERYSNKNNPPQSLKRKRISSNKDLEEEIKRYKNEINAYEEEINEYEEEIRNKYGLGVIFNGTDGDILPMDVPNEYSAEYDCENLQDNQLPPDGFEIDVNPFASDHALNDALKSECKDLGRMSKQPFIIQNYNEEAAGELQQIVERQREAELIEARQRQEERDLERERQAKLDLERERQAAIESEKVYRILINAGVNEGEVQDLEKADKVANEKEIKARFNRKDIVAAQEACKARRRALEKAKVLRNDVRLCRDSHTDTIIDAQIEYWKKMLEFNESIVGYRSCSHNDIIAKEASEKKLKAKIQRETNLAVAQGEYDRIHSTESQETARAKDRAEKNLTNAHNALIRDTGKYEGSKKTLERKSNELKLAKDKMDLRTNELDLEKTKFKEIVEGKSAAPGGGASASVVRLGKQPAAALQSGAGAIDQEKLRRLYPSLFN